MRVWVDYFTIFLVFVEINFQGNPSLFCKFNCIPEKVHQDLTDFAFIGKDKRGTFSLMLNDSCRFFSSSSQSKHVFQTL
jgi:hypothetical protein